MPARALLNLLKRGPALARRLGQRPDTSPRRDHDHNDQARDYSDDNPAHYHDATVPKALEPAAIHEAGHAEVATQLGWEVVSEALIGANTQAKARPGAPRSEFMAYFAAGHLAGLIDSETPAETGFDGLLKVFFKELGDLDVLDDEAGRIGQGIGDDVYELGQLIATSGSRDQGWAEFRQARSTTIDLLTRHWEDVLQRARRLQDESGLDLPA